jgi:hypothetical protein
MEPRRPTTTGRPPRSITHRPARSRTPPGPDRRRCEPPTSLAAPGPPGDSRRATRLRARPWARSARPGPAQHAPHALSARDRGHPDRRLAAHRLRAARLAGRVDNRHPHRDPPAPARLDRRARARAEQQPVATRTAAPRGVGDHPPLRHLERRARRRLAEPAAARTARAAIVRRSPLRVANAAAQPIEWRWPGERAE